MAGRQAGHHFQAFCSLGMLVAALGVPGCTPAAYRRQADRLAYKYIQEKQEQALGRTEPFTIETPAQTLRRRLLLDQELPHSTGASLNTHDIERIKQWPDKDYLTKPRGEVGDLLGSAPEVPVLDQPLQFSLDDALQVAAHGSREYQTEKEGIYVAALQLDLEADAFRRTWSGVLTTLFQSDLSRRLIITGEQVRRARTDWEAVTGMEYSGNLELAQQLKNGLTFSTAVGLDLVTLLTAPQAFSRGIFADATVSLPLLRGAGRFVVTEPLTQAERNLVYAIYNFEQFKRSFAVSIASEYLDVLQQLDQVKNAEDNYRSLITSTRRARRLADAGRLPEIDVDQSRQDELRARQRWIAALGSYQRRLDGFKLTLGLPPDAAIELDPAELARLTERADRLIAATQVGPSLTTAPTTSPATTARATAPSSMPAADSPVELVPPSRETAGPLEIEPDTAVLVALDHRPDLRVAVGRVNDAQRKVAVAADQLQADLTLLGSGSIGARRSIGSAQQPDAILRPDEGSYSVLVTLNLPLERTAEQTVYRNTLIDLEQAVRGVQELEDQVKLAVRNRLSELVESRESVLIQAAAVAVARRRVESTNLFLEAGRAEIRDVLEAQDSLISAQNALTAAMVNYRLGELALQRDLGVLEVEETGLWREYVPPSEVPDDENERSG